MVVTLELRAINRDTVGNLPLKSFGGLGSEQ